MYDQHCSTCKRSGTSQAHVSTGSPTGFPIPRLEPRGNKRRLELRAHCSSQDMVERCCKFTTPSLRSKCQHLSVRTNITAISSIIISWVSNEDWWDSLNEFVSFSQPRVRKASRSSSLWNLPPCGGRDFWSPWSPWRGMLGISWNSMWVGLKTRLRVVVPTSNSIV